jgi:hypothetical protein
MKTLADLVKLPCHFCKQALTPETALVATVSYSLVGSDQWSKPIVIVCCRECAEGECEK